MLPVRLWNLQELISTKQVQQAVGAINEKLMCRSQARRHQVQAVSRLFCLRRVWTSWWPHTLSLLRCQLCLKILQELVTEMKANPKYKPPADHRPEKKHHKIQTTLHAGFSAAI
jgi:hypothetical protein